MERVLNGKPRHAGVPAFDADGDVPRSRKRGAYRVASNVVSNSTASWRRGSMVTGPNLRTTHPLTGVNADGDGVSDALGRSAQRAAPAARRWGVRGMNAYADPW